MKALICLSASILFSVALQAQATSCPVTVTDVRNVEDAIFVLFQNDGSATLTSYQFGFIFVDLRGHKLPFPVLSKGAKTVAPGSGGKLALQTVQSLQFLFPEANAYLMKATFSDGTTWTDDGTHACGATSWQE